MNPGPCARHAWLPETHNHRGYSDRQCKTCSTMQRRYWGEGDEWHVVEPGQKPRPDPMSLGGKVFAVVVVVYVAWAAWSMAKLVGLELPF